MSGFLARVFRAPKTTRFYGSLSEKNHFYRIADDFVRSFPDSARLLDIGSGYRRWRNGILNVDLQTYPMTDVVADGARLPFRDGTFDGVLIQGVLGYCPDPCSVVREIHRVLKIGGRVFADEAYVFPDHPSVEAVGLSTRWRLSPAGLESLFVGFQRKDSGPCMGPASVLALQMRWVLALILSAGSVRTFRYGWHLAGWLVFPLKWMDPCLRLHPYSRFASGSSYFQGEKLGGFPRSFET